MGSWLPLIVAGACAASTAAAAVAGEPRTPDTPYRQLVNQYRAQDAASVDRMAAMPRASVNAAVDAVLSPGAGGSWEVDDLRGAAMLHTDTAVELLQAGRAEEGIFHLNVAGRLLDRTIDVAPPYSSFARRWYDFAILLLMAHHTAMPWLEEFDKRLRARWKLSPAGEQLTRALVAEQQASVKPSRSVRHYVGIAGTDAEIARQYIRAISMFEDAITIDPECHEAWLHMGRLKMLVGENDGAAKAFENALPTPDPRHRYLALLFLGALDEERERFADAERRYRDAMAVYRWGQSAPLALAQLLSRRGRDAEAREVVLAQAARSRGVVVDPLWTYLLAVDDHMSATLDEFRAEVWRK